MNDYTHNFNIISCLVVINENMDLIKTTLNNWQPWEQNIESIRDIISNTNPLAMDLSIHLRGSGLIREADLFSNLIESLDVMARAGNADNYTVFNDEFLSLARDITEVTQQLLDMFNSTDVLEYEWRLSLLNGFINAALALALRLSIQYLTSRAIPTAESCSGSSSPGSNMGGDGFGPMGS